MEVLEPGYYYHIYNHANGNENLFIDNENYIYFLKKYTYYISPIADTYAYCLMPNHFHFLLKVNDERYIKESFPKFQTLEKVEQNKFISKQFSNFFSSYTQSYNKFYKRKGSLFIKNFQRKRIDKDSYLKQAVVYIHLNPVHHGFTTNIKNWKYSSFNAICSENESLIKRKEVIELFDDEQNFFDYHKEKNLNIFNSKMSMNY